MLFLPEVPSRSSFRKLFQEVPSGSSCKKFLWGISSGGCFWSIPGRIFGIILVEIHWRKVERFLKESWMEYLEFIKKISSNTQVNLWWCFKWNERNGFPEEKSEGIPEKMLNPMESSKQLPGGASRGSFLHQHSSRTSWRDFLKIFLEGTFRTNILEKFGGTEGTSWRNFLKGLSGGTSWRNFLKTFSEGTCSRIFQKELSRVNSAFSETTSEGTSEGNSKVTSEGNSEWTSEQRNFQRVFGNSGKTHE